MIFVYLVTQLTFGGLGVGVGHKRVWYREAVPQVIFNPSRPTWKQLMINKTSNKFGPVPSHLKWRRRRRWRWRWRVREPYPRLVSRSSVSQQGRLPGATGAVCAGWCSWQRAASRLTYRQPRTETRQQGGAVATWGGGGGGVKYTGGNTTPTRTARWKLRGEGGVWSLTGNSCRIDSPRVRGRRSPKTSLAIWPRRRRRPDWRRRGTSGNTPRSSWTSSRAGLWRAISEEFFLSFHFDSCNKFFLNNKIRYLLLLLFFLGQSSGYIDFSVS